MFYPAKTGFRPANAGPPGEWELVEPRTVVAADAASVDITGLQGDRDKAYKILAWIDCLGTGNALHLRFNAATTNGLSRRLMADDNTPNDTLNSSRADVHNGVTQEILLQAEIYHAESGVKAVGWAQCTADGPNTVALSRVGVIWNSTAEITSLGLGADGAVYYYPGLLAGSWIEVYRRAAHLR